MKEYIQKVNALKADDVRRVARRYLLIASPISSIVGRKSGSEMNRARYHHRGVQRLDCVD